MKRIIQIIKGTNTADLLIVGLMMFLLGWWLSHVGWAFVMEGM
jgi:hypothetical protein